MYTQDFEVCNGIEEVTVLIRDKQVDENLRYSWLFFISILFLLIWQNGSIICNIKNTTGEKGNLAYTQ